VGSRSGVLVQIQDFAVAGSHLFDMGACMSSESNEELEKKKRSRAIDARLEEDSKRLRRECKILLLGESDHP